MIRCGRGSESWGIVKRLTWVLAIRPPSARKNICQVNICIDKGWDPPDYWGDSRVGRVTTYISNIKKNNRTTKVRHTVAYKRLLPPRHRVPTHDNDLRYLLK